MVTARGRLTSVTFDPSFLLGHHDSQSRFPIGFSHAIGESQPRFSIIQVLIAF
jgi:hypothetical protein